MLEAIGKALKTIGSGIVSAFGSAAGNIIDKLSNANFSGIIDLLNGISLSAIAIGITKFLKSAKDLVDTGASIKGVYPWHSGQRQGLLRGVAAGH